MTWHVEDPRLHAAYARAFYEKRRAAGLCGRCGATPEPGRKSCATCRAYRTDAVKKHLAKTSNAGASDGR